MVKNKKDQVAIITNYFPPEIGAASNRIFHLAKGLSSSYEVTVITPLPNYPTGKIFNGYKNKLYTKSVEEEIKVHRLWSYASVSKNKFVRLFAMLSYSMALIIYFLRNSVPNRVIIQSPPLIVAFTCIKFLKSKKRKVILNVSDLWPNAGLELGALKQNRFYSILTKIERYNYYNADIILGQSNEILTHISQINPNANCLLYRNYPIVENVELINTYTPNGKIRVVYAGLLGVAQGILNLCQNLEFENIELHLYGSGPEEKEIKHFIEEHENLPILFHGKLDRSDLHSALIKYDLAIVPLLKRIYGSVPSKIFELAKLGIPILYFGGGEGESIIQEYDLGWVAQSGNYTNLNSVIKSINPADLTLSRKLAIQKIALEAFSFEKQLETVIDNL